MLCCANISGMVPEMSIDPMKVVQDAILEFTDKKDLFLAYMSSMFVGDQGMLEYYLKENSNSYASVLSL